MRPRLSPPRALITLLACGAMACSLGSTGLMEPVEDGAKTPPGTTASSGSGSGGATGNPGLGAPDAATLAPPGSSGGGSGSGGSSNGGAMPPAADGGTDPAGGDDDDDDDASIPDAGLPDVHVLAPDAAIADGGPACDLDEDGFLAMGACGGTDCCDYDGRAHPGDTDFFATQDACGSFDYDCDGQDSTQFPIADCSLHGFSCGANGFDKVSPPCGTSATYDTCKYEVFSCSSTQGAQIQACR